VPSRHEIAQHFLCLGLEQAYAGNTIPPRGNRNLPSFEFTGKPTQLPLSPASHHFIMIFS
jgi:hypothetical protein